MTVVLNDNEMSIAPNVGALSIYLNKLITNPKYNKIKDELENLLYKIPRIGGITKQISKKIQESIKNLVVPKIIFEEFGFRYFGPIDGHNISELIRTFNSMLYFSGPKLLHIRTTKGKGYYPAENNPSFYHGLGPFDKESGEVIIFNTPKISFTTVFGETITALAETNKDIIAITAAMPEGTGLSIFKRKFPERFFDVGIAEDFAVTFAGGLAAQGKLPVVAIYSTFLQRSIDQIYHDILLQENLHCILAIDRAGLVGADGPTHHGTLDLTYLLMLPNIIVLAPADEFDLVAMLKKAVSLKNQTIAIRYPRANIEANEIPKIIEVEEDAIIIGRPQILAEGKKALVLAAGPLVKKIQKINTIEKLDLQILNCRTLKPLDTDYYIELISKFEYIITIEENTEVGGFGAYINSFINKHKLYNKKILNIALPDKFITAGEIDELYKLLGLDETALTEKIKNFLKS